MLPAALARLVGWGLPFVEIALGLLLIVGPAHPDRGDRSAAGLMVVFIAAVASAAARGLSIDCGCFGGGGQVAPGQTAVRCGDRPRRGLLLLALWLRGNPAAGSPGPRRSDTASSDRREQPQSRAGRTTWPDKREPSDSGSMKPSRTRVAPRERARQAGWRRRRRDRRIIDRRRGRPRVLIGGGIALQAWRTPGPRSATPAAAVIGAPVTITSGKPIVLGNADAPVTSTLYEDFHCPHCADFEEEFGATITAAQEAGTAQVELYPMSFIDQGSASGGQRHGLRGRGGLRPGVLPGLFANHTLQWNDDQLIEPGRPGDRGTTPARFATCVRRASTPPG